VGEVTKQDGRKKRERVARGAGGAEGPAEAALEKQKAKQNRIGGELQIEREREARGKNEGRGRERGGKGVV
jgi:hypothetical protein